MRVCEECVCVFEWRGCEECVCVCVSGVCVSVCVMCRVCEECVCVCVCE